MGSTSRAGGPELVDRDQVLVQTDCHSEFSPPGRAGLPASTMWVYPCFTGGVKAWEQAGACPPSGGSSGRRSAARDLKQVAGAGGRLRSLSRQRRGRTSRVPQQLLMNR